jgi:hypothetical protein
MVSERQAKRLCSNYSQIENYEKAVSDKTQTWHCHHRLELKCPVYKPKAKELMEYGLYYDRPPEELIFLTPQEHIYLHQITNNSFIGKKHSKESKKIMSLHGGNAFRGKHHTPESIEKNRLSHLGKKHDKSFGEEISKRNTGRKWFTDGVNNRFCFECPEGYRKGRSEYSYRGVLKQNSKKTICITTGKIFESASEAARFYNLLEPCVRRAAGSNKTYGTYKNERLAWSYI